MNREKMRNMLRRLLIKGPARNMSRILFNALISVELAAQRGLDIFQTPNEPLPPRQITAIIKTFNRTQELAQLVKSIQRVQPDLEIIIADDSRESTRFPGVTTLVLPFNCGISAGRNAALDIVHTPFVLILDDDFVFYRKTRLAGALRILQQTPQIDIMGGKVINLPECRPHDYRDAALFPASRAPTFPKGSLLAGLPVYDKVANFFIGRTDPRPAGPAGAPQVRVAHPLSSAAAGAARQALHPHQIPHHDRQAGRARQPAARRRTADEIWQIPPRQQPGRTAGTVECAERGDEPGGAAPLLMQYLPLYTPEQARRHEVRPGITGWAQVNGRNALSWEEKFALDVWYVDNHTLWLDWKIIFLTLLKIVKRDGINQPGQATMQAFF
jgi:hypothetical protein